MGLVENAKSFFTIGGSKAAPALPTGNNAWGVMTLPRTRRDYQADIRQDRLMDTSIVAAVLGWIARTFPEAPVQVKERNDKGDYEVVQDHDLPFLIEIPNPFYSGILLWYASIIDWWIDGNAYWLIMRDKSTNKPVQLWWIPHWMMNPKGPDNSTTTNFITHYEYKPTPSTTFKIAPKDVIHFRHGLDPNNTRKGLGKFKPLFREIFTDEEAANFTAALLVNMGVPGLVISPQGHDDDEPYIISQNEADATKQYVKDRLTGDNRGEALVFKGPLKVEQFGFSPQQMDLKSLRRIPEERVSAVTGVAAIVAGLGAGLDRSTFANYAEAREAAYEENIIPTQRFFSADLRVQLLREYETDLRKFRVGFDTSDVRILQEDKNKETERYVNQWRGGVAKLSEVRAKLGFDTDPSQELFAVPMSIELVPANALEQYAIDDAGTPYGQQGATGASAGLGAAGRYLPIAQGGKASGWPVGTQAKASARDRAYLRRIARRAVRIEGAMRNDLGDIYTDIGSAASSVFLNLPDIPKSRDAEQKDSLSESILSDLVERIMGSQSFEEILQEKINDFVRSFGRSYSRTGEMVFEETSGFLGIDIGWNLDDPGSQRIITMGRQRALGLSTEDTVRREVRKAVSEGYSEGLGPRAIAQRIKTEVGSTKQASTIARTEVKFAQNVSSIEAYRKSEVVTGLRAFDNQTGYDDDDCMARNGEIYSFEQAELLTAAEHPNGTLSWAPVTRE